MNRLTRKILVVLGAAMALAGTGGAALAATAAPARTAPAARTVTTSVPRCLEQNLSAGLHGAEAAGDHVGFILTLTNKGQRSCSVDGYPGLGLQDWNHHAVPSRTFWGSTWFDRDPGRHQIVLSPGETASASLAFTTGSARGAVDAAYLVVTPPNDYDHMVIGPFSRSMEFPSTTVTCTSPRWPTTPRIRDAGRQPGQQRPPSSPRSVVTASTRASTAYSVH